MDKIIRIAVIEGFENYIINELGEVINTKTDKVVKQCFRGDYLTVHLSNNEKRARFIVHRLLAIYFIPNPENKPQVNHINGIKTDNRLENLEWCTRKENAQHAVKSGLWKSSDKHKKSASERTILRNQRGVLNIYTGIYYDSVTEAAATINIKMKTLNARLVRKSKKNTPFIYV